MRERFAQWVLLMLALALTLLGRPDGAFDRAYADEETVRPVQDDLSLMSEQRRAPGVRTDTERQSKPSAATTTALDVVLFGELAIAAAYAEIEWSVRSSWCRGDRSSPASARGPPVLA